MRTGLSALQPELGAGGFPAHDGTLEFYNRISALVTPQSHVLDLGAGRGAWAHDDPCEYRRQLRWLRGRAAKVTGCDVDPIVLTNPSLDDAFIIEPGKPLAMADASCDVIVADYVLEHVSDAKLFAAEVERLLKLGGWFCARTPARFHYVAIISSLLPEKLHQRALGQAQKERKGKDVFPAHYLLNTRAAISRYFPKERFEDCTYIYCNEPQYHFSRKMIYRGLKAAHWLMPAALQGNLFVFLRKRI